MGKPTTEIDEFPDVVYVTRSKEVNGEEHFNNMYEDVVTAIDNVCTVEEEGDEYRDLPFVATYKLANIKRVLPKSLGKIVKEVRRDREF
jgi:hypothetical protein